MSTSCASHRGKSGHHHRMQSPSSARPPASRQPQEPRDHSDWRRVIILFTQKLPGDGGSSWSLPESS
ncbi:hypothetical protein J6590_012388 [Homalodisca vitripennis]|nr:hypothetical protein J6590_012388 [Homalodisca vitripennis]